MSEHHFNQCGRSLTCELSVVVQHVKKEGQETFLIVSCHPMHLKAAKENNLDHLLLTTGKRVASSSLDWC